MLTTLKSIVRRLPFSEISICYYKPSQDEQYPIHFRCISKGHQFKYDALSETEKRDYISNSAQIYIPDMSIHEFSALYEQTDPFVWNYTIDKICKLCMSDTLHEKSEDMFALYTILHEVGHWIHFDSLGKNVWEYAQISKAGKGVSDLQYKLQQKITNQGNRVLSADIKERKRLLEMYNALPCEKIANDFADAKFCEMWKLIQDL